MIQTDAAKAGLDLVGFNLGQIYSGWRLLFAKPLELLSTHMTPKQLYLKSKRSGVGGVCLHQFKSTRWRGVCHLIRVGF